MNLADLYAQQQKDLETFKTVRDKTWSQLKQDHEEIIKSFGEEAKLPEDYRKRFDEQIANFQREWSVNGGTRYADMVEQHTKQREAITGKKSEMPAQAKQQERDMISEKQNELQKIIAMQQAIRKKNEERKRKR